MEDNLLWCDEPTLVKSISSYATLNDDLSFTVAIPTKVILAPVGIHYVFDPAIKDVRPAYLYENVKINVDIIPHHGIYRVEGKDLDEDIMAFLRGRLGGTRKMLKKGTVNKKKSKCGKRKGIYRS
jgi:hypothetical protein